MDTWSKPCVREGCYSTKNLQTTSSIIRTDGKRIMYHDFGFSLAFAVTYHKIQGKTVPKLILDLNNNSQVPLQLQSLYVGISRVRCSKDLRILPPLSSSSANMVHLTRLHH